MTEFADLPPNKQMHLFYGMPEAYYDAGLRYDWDNKTSERLPDGTLQFSFPVVWHDGSPVVIKSIRSEGKRVEKVNVKA